MKKLMFFFIISVLAFPAFSQNYLSNNEKSGNWETTSTWSPSIPGNITSAFIDVNEQNANVRIQGTVTVNRDLNISGNGARVSIEAADTLYILGNLIISGKGGLNLENGGVLVVVGNMTVEGNSVNNNNGTIIVAQNLSVSGNTNFNNNAGAGQGIYAGSVSGNKTISGGSILPLDNSSSGRDAATEHSLIYNTVIRPQPVELLTFQGKSTARGIQLDWITAWEENFDYFIVERAGTDRQFKAIGKVQGNGNTQAEVAYNFTDEQPIQGQALYRLKAVDYDNSYEYHNIISVYFDGMYKQALKVYPNPSADRLIHVDLNSEIHTITLLNTNGQLIYQTMVNNYSASIDLPTSIRSGAYLLVVTDEQGNSVKEKIMVL